MKKIAIIGAGSWGTALAVALARSRAPHRLALWAHGADVLASLRERRENSVYLPGFHVEDKVQVTGNLAEAVEGASVVLGVMPSQHARAVYSAMLPVLNSQTSSQPLAETIFVSATKGLEHSSLSRMSEVVASVLGARVAPRVAVLSGPSFAREVARADPTAVVVAAPDLAVAEAIQAEFSGPTLRLYTNSDVAGVEIAAAVTSAIPGARSRSSRRLSPRRFTFDPRRLCVAIPATSTRS